MRISAPQGYPMSPSSGTKPGTVVLATQLPVSVNPYALMTSDAPSTSGSSARAPAESGAEPHSTRVSVCARGGADPKSQRPEGRHRRHARDRVLVDEHSELGQEARLEGRHHEQGLAGEPRKSALQISP
jgi:hypothetical protein